MGTMYVHRSGISCTAGRSHECVNKFERTDVVEKLRARNREEMERDCHQK
jgi:hypothetical protein